MEPNNKPINKTKTQIFPCGMQGVYCDEYNCRERAVFFIGRPDSPINKRRKLCAHHKQELVDSIINNFLVSDNLGLAAQVPAHQVPAQDNETETDSTEKEQTVIGDVAPVEAESGPSRKKARGK